jgi:hypothetical protein
MSYTRTMFLLKDICQTLGHICRTRGLIYLDIYAKHENTSVLHGKHRIYITHCFMYCICVYTLHTAIHWFMYCICVYTLHRYILVYVLYLCLHTTHRYTLVYVLYLCLHITHRYTLVCKRFAGQTPASAYASEPHQYLKLLMIQTDKGNTITFISNSHFL